MNSTAQAALNAPTRESGPSPKTDNEREQNSFPKRKQVFKFREEIGASPMGNAKQ